MDENRDLEVTKPAKPMALSRMGRAFQSLRSYRDNRKQQYEDARAEFEDADSVVNAVDAIFEAWNARLDELQTGLDAVIAAATDMRKKTKKDQERLRKMFDSK